jgi:hypothetical protein
VIAADEIHYVAFVNRIGFLLYSESSASSRGEELSRTNGHKAKSGWLVEVATTRFTWSEEKIGKWSTAAG